MSSKDFGLSLCRSHICCQPFLHQDFYIVVADVRHHFWGWLIDLLIAVGYMFVVVTTFNPFYEEIVKL